MSEKRGWMLRLGEGNHGFNSEVLEIIEAEKVKQGHTPFETSL